MVDGLYAGNTSQVADFKTIVFRQKQLGFNAVRLPMTFSDLGLAPKMWTKSCRDDTSSLKVCQCSPCMKQAAAMPKCTAGNIDIKCTTCLCNRAMALLLPYAFI